MEEQDKGWEDPLHMYQKQQNDNNSVKANSARSKNLSERDQDFNCFQNQTYQKKLQQNENIAKGSQQKGNIDQDIQKMMDGNSVKNTQISFVDIDYHLSKSQFELKNIKKVYKTILDYFQSFQVQQVKKFVRLIMQCPWRKKQNKYQLSTKQMCLIFQIIVFLKHIINKSMKIPVYLSVLAEIFNTKTNLYEMDVSMQIFFDQNENNQQYFGQDDAEIFQIKKIFAQFKQSVSQILDKMDSFTFTSALYNLLAEFCINGMQNQLKAKPKNAQIVKYLSSSNMFQSLNFIKITSHLIELKESQIKKQTKVEFQEYCKQILLFASGTSKYIETYVFPIIDELLLQDSSMDRKSQAIKMIGQLVQSEKIYSETTSCVLAYIQKKDIFQKFVNDRTHHEILKKFPPIIRFLYDQKQISTEKILNLVLESIHGHQQFLKVIQGIMHYIKLSDLEQVFNILKDQKSFGNSHFSRYFNNIIGNFNLSPHNSKSKKKRSASSKKIKKQNEILSMIEEEKQQPELNYMEIEQNSSLTKFLQKLFYFLMGLLQKHQNIYIQIFCRLISTQIQIILPFLRLQLINKLKASHSYSLWILQHILKIQADKEEQKKNNSNSKVNAYIHDLLSENLYQCIYLILSKNRLDKVIVEKSINVIILLCKSFKALDKTNVQNLWLILAKNSRDQSERQQFFQFLKELLKSKNTLSQEAAKHIYFQLFLKLHYEWFSIKIYDCFEMLFLRLNQDWKLLNYQNGSYTIENIQFVGIEKFFYLYFCAQAKVSKKIRQFFYKISLYGCQLQMRQKLFKLYLNWITAYLKKDEETPAKNLRAKTEIEYKTHVNRAFQFFLKMIQAPKLNADQNGEQNMIQLNIKNATRQACPPLKKVIQVNKNIKLKNLRQTIQKTINPGLKEIKLVAKGSELKLDNLTLKQLKIQNSNTILVENIDIIPEQIKNQISEQKQQNQNKSIFFSIFSQSYTPQFLQFVLQKYQGYDLQKVCEIAVDNERMRQLKVQFDQLEELQKEKENSASNNLILQEEQALVIPKKFDQLLSQQIPLLLEIINNQTNMIQSKHWSLIRKIPPNRQIWRYIEKQIQNQQPSWNTIFNHLSECVSSQIYCFYILKKIIQSKPQEKANEFSHNLFEVKSLKNYIFKVLDQLFKDKSYDLELYSQILSLLSIRIPNQQILLECHLSQSIALQMFAHIHKIDEFVQKYQINQNQIFSIKNVISILQIIEQNNVQKSIASTLLFYSLLSLNYFRKQNKDINKFQDLKLIQQLQSDKIIRLCCKYDEKFITFYLCCLILNVKTFESEVIFKNTYNKLKNMILSGQQNLIMKEMQSNFKQTSKMSAFHSFPNSNNKVQWFFTLLVALIQLSEIQGEQEYQILLIKHFMDSFLILTVNQISGMLFFLNHIIKANHIKHQNKIPLDQKFTEKSCKMIDQFGKWLFSTFIFDSNQLLMNQTILKSNYFLLAKTISQIDRNKFHLICKDIINFGTQKRNSQNDHIDLRTKQFIGIRNLGSTCYINSLTQQLYHTKFSQLLLQSQNISNQLSQLKRTFAQLYATVKDVINIRPMINQVKFYGQQIIPTIQQDAEQFLMSLFNHIQSCGQKNLLQQVFGGSYCQQLTYFQGEQNFKKYKTEQFYNITLDIKGKKHLNEALTYFSRYQVLDQKIYCEQLKKRTNVGKKTLIEKFPNILIITLKRFQFDVSSQTRNKLNDPLQFFVDLDLNFISSKNRKRQSCENVQNQYSEDYKYKLCGVLVHSGSAQSGHYYSYIKVSDKWYEFNDRQVFQINQIQKFKTEGFGCAQNKSKSAYILFYQKQNQQKNKLYHGISLDKISKQNFYLQKVQEENKKFIKQRFIFDAEYKKFVDFLLQKLCERKSQKKSEKKDKELDLSDAEEQSILLQKLNDIKQIISPKTKIYFDGVDNRQVQFI